MNMKRLTNQQVGGILILPSSGNLQEDGACVQHSTLVRPCPTKSRTLCWLEPSDFLTN